MSECPCLSDSQCLSVCVTVRVCLSVRVPVCTRMSVSVSVCTRMSVSVVGGVSMSVCPWSVVSACPCVRGRWIPRNSEKFMKTTRVHPPLYHYSVLYVYTATCRADVSLWFTRLLLVTKGAHKTCSFRGALKS